MNNNKFSKSLGINDSSGFEFAKEMLQGDVTSAINFDRLQFHPQSGYIIFEYLLCEEWQTVTPHSSHPNRYWHINSRKFISLWKAKCKLDARLFLVNYAKKGTAHEDEILVIEVLNVSDTGIINDKKKQMTRKEFSDWFRKVNKQCLDE